MIWLRNKASYMETLRNQLWRWISRHSEHRIALSVIIC